MKDEALAARCRRLRLLLSDVLAELKRYGKARSASVVVSERRNAAGAPEMVLVGEEEDEVD